MNWKLDDISFQSYGVYVTGSKGLLDLPKIDIPDFDWLDEEGIEFIPDTVISHRTKDREIRIECLMMAGNLSDFESKLNAFWNVLKAADMRVLSCDYLSSPIEVYLEKEIRVNRITSWHEAKQYGTFRLYLTVPGDSKYNLITVKRWTSADGLSYPAVVKTSNLKVNKSLQGDISLSLSCESNEPLDIRYDDWVDYEYDASHSDRFIINGEPQFTKNSTNKYVYNLTFEFKGTNYLNRAEFVNDLEEADFPHYGDMDSILGMIITSYGLRGYNVFTKGTCPATLTKNHQFNGETCLEVLRRMCTEYELEYEFEKNDPNWWDYTINIKEKVATTKAVSFQYGKGNGLYKLHRGERIKGWYCNKLRAFGAAKNLPSDYRGGLRRLSFDGNPLYVPNIDPVEHYVPFDDIYPQRTGAVESYTQVLKDDLTAAQAEVDPGGIYQIVDSSLANADPDYDLNINDYLLAGQTAKVVMKTGALAGYEFDIKRYDHDTQTISIIPFTENDYTVPNATLQIAAGDEYTLINIDQPVGYITEAEDALEAAAMEYLAEHSQPKFEYNITVSPAYVAANNIYFEVGDEITVIDTDYGINGLFRISKLTYNDYTKVYELTLSDKTNYPRLQMMESKVKKLERAAEETGTSDVENMRDSQQTVGDLSRTLIDPLDGKFKADDIVRRHSLDPGHLSIDNEPTFYIEDALVELNYGGNEDAVKVDAGKIRVTNYHPLTRYEIAKLKSGGGSYDPTRTWNIPETTLALPTKDAYMLYLKLNLASGSTACTIEAHKDHIEGKDLITDGYLYKRFFPISKGEEAAV